MNIIISVACVSFDTQCGQNLDRHVTQLTIPLLINIHTARHNRLDTVRKSFDSYTNTINKTPL